MKITLLTTILAFLLFSCNNKTEKQEQKPVQETENNENSNIVVAYVAGWKNTVISEIKAEKLTHINYAFANIINGKVAFGSEKDSIDNSILNENDLIELRKLKSKNPKLKILVSVGGWTWSGNFSDAALSDSTRKVFAISAAEFVNKYQLDGIDLDWEYPNQIGAGNIHREEDKENFTLLLKEVRNELNKIETREKNLLLTIASGGDTAYITNTNLGEASKYLDFINIMTYDFYNGLHNITGHHANLFPAKNDSAIQLKKEDIRSASLSVKAHIEAGVPKSKLVLGIPFYGRKWTGVKENNKNGLFVYASSVGTITSYDEIKANYLNSNLYSYFFDSTARAPYIYSEEEKIFISFENTESLKEKLDFIEETGLRGVMFWEYSKDKDGDLLNMIFER